MFVHVLYRVCFTYASRYRVADLRRENASSFSAENGREMGKVSLRFFLFSNFVYVSCNGQLGKSACFFFSYRFFDVGNFRILGVRRIFLCIESD